jgi:hypothetical protein
MPWHMVSGKPSNQSARKVDSSPTTRLLIYVYTHQRVGVCSAEQTGIRSYNRAVDVCPAHWMCVWSYSRLWLHCSTTRNERQTVASERPVGVPSVWVRFTLQGLKFDSESSVSRGDWGCLILLPHRVTSAILRWVILKHALKRLLPCLSSHRCLPRMVKGTRTWKLKYEIKELLFVAFQLRQNPKPH